MESRRAGGGILGTSAMVFVGVVTVLASITSRQGAGGEIEAMDMQSPAEVAKALTFDPFEPGRYLAEEQVDKSVAPEQTQPIANPAPQATSEVGMLALAHSIPGFSKRPVMPKQVQGPKVASVNAGKPVAIDSPEFLGTRRATIAKADPPGKLGSKGKASKLPAKLKKMLFKGKWMPAAAAIGAGGIAAGWGGYVMVAGNEGNDHGRRARTVATPSP